MTLSPGDSLGHYRILSLLGSGGMGVVYLAEDMSLHRQVAVKVLPAEVLQDKERRARFVREARAAAAVDHPNVIHIYEVNEDPGGAIYLVMQHVEGKPLRQILSTGRLDLDRTFSVATEVADALSAAHAKGIVHRDIKPDNIMLDSTGHARILDFGLARALEPSSAGGSEIETVAGHSTSPGVVMGTVAYMSPEQARGEVVDARSDLFSFGVMLYEMLAGRHPFVGRTSIETADALLHQDPKPVSVLVPGVPPETEWVLSKMLAKDREERYQSARELLTDLRKLRHSSSGASAVAPPGRAGRAAWRWRGYRLWIPIVAVALVLLVPMAFGIRYALRKHDGDRVRLEFPGGVPPGLKDLPGIERGVKTIIQQATSASEPMRLAVLPFQNVRHEARIDFLGFALADAIISKLSYVQSLSVRPSSYIQKYRDQTPDPKQAGRDLGVDHLLTGSLLAEGEAVRVSVQLVDLESDTIRWQDSLDARMDDLFRLQDQIVTRVTSGLQITLSPTESARLRRDVPRRPEAYRIFLQSLSEPETIEGYRRAIDLAEQSIQLDPDFADAWAALARKQYEASLYGGRGGEGYAEAERSARRALAINPEQPQALQRIVVILTEMGRHEEAYLQARRWIGVSPSSAEAHFSLSYLYRYTGMLEESAAEGERALQLAPGTSNFRSLGFSYVYMGKLDRAVEIINLDAGTFWSLFNLMDLAWMRGDKAKARELAEKVIKTDPNSRVATEASFLIRALDGDRAGAAEALARHVKSMPPDPEYMQTIAASFAGFGDAERSLDALRRSVESGFYTYQAFENDPRFAFLRGRPEFDSIIQEARRRHEKFKAFVAANPAQAS